MIKGLLFSAFIFLGHSAVAYAKGQEIEYEELNLVQDLVANKVDSKYFVCIFRLNIKNPEMSYQDIDLWLTRDGEKIAEGTVDGDGNISFPILDDNEAQNVMMHISHAKEDVEMRLYTDVAPITELAVSYQELFSVLDDLNTFTSVMAGGMSWLVPSLDELEFTFDKPATISFIKQNGKEHTFKSDDKNKIEISLRKKWLKLNPTLTFSHLPKSYTANF